MPSAWSTFASGRKGAVNNSCDILPVQSANACWCWPPRRRADQRLRLSSRCRHKAALAALLRTCTRGRDESANQRVDGGRCCQQRLEHRVDPCFTARRGNGARPAQPGPGAATLQCLPGAQADRRDCSSRLRLKAPSGVGSLLHPRFALSLLCRPELA